MNVIQNAPGLKPSEHFMTSQIMILRKLSYCLNSNRIHTAEILVFFRNRLVCENVMDLFQWAVSHQRKDAEFRMIRENKAFHTVCSDCLLYSVLLFGCIGQTVFHRKICSCHECFSDINRFQIVCYFYINERKSLSF